MVEKTNSSNMVYISLVAIVAIVAMVVLLTGHTGPAANHLARDAVYSQAPAAADSDNLGGEAMHSPSPTMGPFSLMGPPKTLGHSIFTCSNFLDMGNDPMQAGYIQTMTTSGAVTYTSDEQVEGTVIREYFCSADHKIAYQQDVNCNYGYAVNSDNRAYCLPASSKKALGSK